MCRSPRNPHLKPNPSATDDSGVKVNEASFNCSFSSDVRNISKSSASMGYTPAKTIGFTSSKPSIAAEHGFSTVVMVSHLYFRSGLDAAYDVSYVTASQSLFGTKVHFQHSDFIGIVLLFGIDEEDILSASDGTVDNFEIGNDTPIAIEDRVEDECLKRSFRVACRCGNALHHSTEYVVDALSCLS